MAKAFLDVRMLVLYFFIAGIMTGVQWIWVEFMQDYLPVEGKMCELKPSAEISSDMEIDCGNIREVATGALIALALANGSPNVACQIRRGTYTNSPDIECPTE